MTQRKWVWVIGVIVLLLILGGVFSQANPNLSFLRTSEQAKPEDNKPSKSSATQQDPSSTTQETKGSAKVVDQAPSSPPEAAPTSALSLLRQAVKDYYEAVDREDWEYTYDNLDSQTKQRFSKEEWNQKNQWFADNSPQKLASIEIDANISSSGTLADVTVNRTFEDGSSSVRDTYFVYEDGSWKHRFSQEELNLFMPDVSFEEFVKRQQGGSSETSRDTQPSTKSDTSDEPSDSKAEGAAPQASPGSQAAAGDQTNSGGYYASSYKTASTIYCANDPEWRNLSSKYLEHFDTLEQAQQAFPGRHLHRPC